MEKTNSLKKIDNDTFEVTETRKLVVDKKGLIQEIEEIKARIDEKEKNVGLPSLREKLAVKEALLEEANQLK